jgi:outer membrane protein TolC
MRGALALSLAVPATHATAQPAPQAPLAPQAPQTPPAATAPMVTPDPNARPLTIDEAVALALEQNVSLRVERMNPNITELDLSQAYSAWLPALTGNLRFNSSSTPPSSFLETDEDSLTSKTFSGTGGVEQFLPSGGSYTFGFQGSRNETNNAFAALNPSTRGNLTFSFTQPLLRNRSIDNTRQQILVSRTNLAISEFDLRNTVVTTIRNVKNAYWDLVVALSNLAVQQQTLELSRQTLTDNRKRVEVGTMAPIDIVQAEAEVAGNEESVILAEQSVAQAQDRLRALILDPGTTNFWTTTFTPTDAPVLAPTPVDIEAAVTNAAQNRLDLKQTRAQLENNQTRIQFLRNQVLPQLNANVDYGLAGLGGTVINREFDPSNPLGGGSVTSETNRRYNQVLSDLFGFNFPTWTVALQFRYPLGRNSDRINLTRAELQNDQALLRLQDTERQVVQQVRDLGRQVNTNLRRVGSTQAARALAEKRLEAEEKKFGVGLSTTFNVLQAQRDLAAARNNEQRAILDYVKSLVDFEASQEASIGGGTGVSVVTGGGTAGGTATGGGFTTGGATTGGGTAGGGVVR